MADRYDSNGDSSRKDVDHMEAGDADEASQANSKVGEYVRELLAEKVNLDQTKWPNAARLIDQEVAKVQAMGKAPARDYKYVDIYREKPIKVSVKVLVPVREHPKFNFVGKLLGPKGNSMKRLQEETMCKMAVLGRGSMKDRQREEELRNSLEPKYSHLSDDLHVEISALGPPAEAHARIAYALAEVRKYLIPDNNDNIRQEQMREMEIMSTEPQAGGGVEPSRISSRTSSRSSLLSRVPSSTRPPPMRTATRAPVLTPRVMPAKTKIMSILDRARVAMEESYGYEDDLPSERLYSDPYSRSAYYDDDYDHEYYHRDVPDPYSEASSRSWKAAYKASSSSSSRHESSRYRSSPYSRPTK